MCRRGQEDGDERGRSPRQGARFRARVRDPGHPGGRSRHQDDRGCHPASAQWLSSEEKAACLKAFDFLWSPGHCRKDFSTELNDRVLGWKV